ncbi:MAG: hypothetical protein GY737_26340 [Desulfobacteraceae bacterium]|nr:hypothetical protein [Desulfobacteraceae bacterium]
MKQEILSHKKTGFSKGIRRTDKGHEKFNFVQTGQRPWQSSQKESFWEFMWKNQDFHGMSLGIPAIRKSFKTTGQTNGYDTRRRR